MNNEEYIKSLNTNQLAKFFYKVCDCSLCPADTFTCKCSDRFLYCEKNIEEWLKKEKKEKK